VDRVVPDKVEQGAQQPDRDWGPRRTRLMESEDLYCYDENVSNYLDH
jgi:hypothetical protein